MKRLLSCIGALIVVSGLLSAADWQPLGPDDLSLKAGRVDPKADAEVLVWHIWISDLIRGEDLETIHRNYIRLKVFNDKSAQKFEPPKITYSKDQDVYDVAARVIQPDGSTQELDKKAIFQTVVEKRKGSKDRAVSFAIPGIKAGSIIEYQWKESSNKESADHTLIELWQDYPVEKLILHIKPLNDDRWPYPMKFWPYHLASWPKFNNEGATGYSVAEIDDLKAYPDEEDAPPPLDLKPFIVVYYAKDTGKETPDQYWKMMDKEINDYYKPLIHVNGDVKALATEIIGNTTDPDQQVVKLAVYCRKNIKDIWGKEVSDAERKKIKQNLTTAETLKRGEGTKTDRQLAFLALCRAAGFDAQIALVSDRELVTFTPELRNAIFLPWLRVAVNVNDKWKVYDTTTSYIEPGKLRWQEEGTQALVLGEKQPVWALSPLSTSADNQVLRAGKAKLDENGGLEGDFTETRTGHEAEIWRSEYEDMSPGEREKFLKGRVQSHFPGAEISNIQIPDPKDVNARVVVSYHLKMDAFATRAGKRLIFIPNLYGANSSARYTSNNRLYDLNYSFPWTEVVDYDITVPDGFAFDHPQIPPKQRLAGAGEYEARMRIINGNIASYHREIKFGDGYLQIPQKSYPTVKKIFDVVQEFDTMAETLKQKDESAQVHAQ